MQGGPVLGARGKVRGAEDVGYLWGWARSWLRAEEDLLLLPLQEGGLAVTIDSPCFYTLGLQEKGLAQSHIAGGTWAGTDGSPAPLDPGGQAPSSAVCQWRDHLTS